MTEREIERRSANGIVPRPKNLGDVWYDYKNQAWVKDGKYLDCSHPRAFICGCYGRLHEGETADNSLREREF